MVGRGHDRRRRHQPGARGARAQVRHDALRESEGGRRATSSRTSSSSPAAAPTTASSASATSKLMRQALECCHRGWGVASSSASPAPGRRSRRGRSSSSPAASGRAPRSAARAAAPTCRRSSTGTWTGKIEIDDLITHKLPLERINEAFDLMHAGESIRAVVEY